MLYQHSPRTLVPLLRAHMPCSITMLATILGNPPADASSSSSSAPMLDSVYATFPPSADGSDITPETLTTLGIGAHAWFIAAPLPGPSVQLRAHHGLSSLPPAEQTGPALDAAREMVTAALKELAARYPEHPVVGSMHALFLEQARGVFGGPERHTTYTYIAPNGGWGPTAVDAVTGVLPWEDELVLGPGDPRDAPLIHSTNAYRSVEYYAARAMCTTALRPRRADGEYAPPAAWVMTHGDGSVGALWTQPAYRRRGLAKVVLARHLADLAEQGVPGHCYVEEGNDASMRLWEGMGWSTIPFTFYWVYADEHTEVNKNGP